jgi:hypothetical protein
MTVAFSPGMTLWLLLACGGMTAYYPEARSQRVADGAPDVVHEHVSAGPTAEELSDWLFDGGVHTVELTLGADAIAAMEADGGYWAVADVLIDGEAVEDVGVRRKSYGGSNRSMYSKPALKLDFNRFVDDRSFYGLEKLTLNNMVQDPSFVRERVAYDVYEANDLPHLRSGYVWLRIDGQDYGLYANVESPDDVWLENTYEAPDGNLYDADYAQNPFTLVDFEASVQHLFTLDEGEEVALADISAVTSAIDATWGQPGTRAALDRVVNTDEALRMWAVDLWLAHWDGYFFNSNNYRVYFDPADGKAALVPWGLDQTFEDQRDWTTPRGRVAQACLADPSCAADFLPVLDDVCATIDAMDLRHDIDAAAAIANPYVDQDPKKEVTGDTARATQDQMRAFVDSRSAAVRALYGL